MNTQTLKGLVKDRQIYAVAGIILFLVALFFYLFYLGIQARLNGESSLPATGLNRPSWESIFVAVTVVITAFVLALLPFTLVISFFTGSRRERVKGDIWADLSRMNLAKFLTESGEFEELLSRQSDQEAPVHPHVEKQAVVDRACLARAFNRRFDDYYAPSAYFAPCLAFIIVCFLGWMIVLFPNAYSGGDADHPGFPALMQNGLISYFQQTSQAGSIFSFSFLGAYFWSLQTFIRRYSASDLKPTMLSASAVRIVSGWISAFVLLVALPDTWGAPNTAWWKPAFGFFLGMFTLPIVQSLWETVKQRQLPLVTRGFGAENDLTDLQGVNAFHADRLAEEGIESIDALTTANLVDLLMHTRYPTDMVVDWIDKALLYRHAGKNSVEHLKEFGIVAASDLWDVWEDKKGEDNRLLTRGELVKALSEHKSKDKDQALTEVKLKGIVTCLERAPNFRHVYGYWEKARVGVRG